MLNKSKKEILDNNYVLNSMKNSKTINSFKKHKTKNFFIGILIGIIIFITLYFLSSYSTIFHISVNGNKYLSEKDILKIASINENDKFLLVFPDVKKEELKKSEFISDASVELLDGRIVKITVDELKQIGYLNDAGEPKILLEDGTRVLLNTDNMYLINNIPLIEGFSNTQLETVLIGLKKLEKEDLENISEIHNSPVSYDQNRMEIIMRDGNYIYVSWTGLDMIKNYQSIVTGLQLNGRNACIYLDELTNSGYVSACPWQS